MTAALDGVYSDSVPAVNVVDGEIESTRHWQRARAGVKPPTEGEMKALNERVSLRIIFRASCSF